MPPQAAPELYYWHREAKSSNAEVDFIFKLDEQAIPVEVKSGSSGKMRSLQSFMQSHPHIQSALKISEEFYDQDGWLKQIPLYGISGLFPH